MKKLQLAILTLAIMATGFCGMIAEFSVSAIIGYFEGDTVAAFTLTIGVFLLAMALGSFASKLIQQKELQKFLLIEIALSVVTSASAVIIAQAAAHEIAWEASILIAALIGALIGFEIPLLMRINEQHGIILKENASWVFGGDYVGSFAAGATFSWYFLPHLGLIKTPIFSGALNFAIVILMFVAFSKRIPKLQIGMAMTAACVLILGLNSYGETIVFNSEQKLYEDVIVYQEQTAYQKIVVTEDKEGDNTCIFLNGKTQACSQDEPRYHEYLVHIPFWLKPDPRKVLVLGGGDGMAIREVLKYQSVNYVNLIDLDQKMVELCRTNPKIAAMNQHSFNDSRVHFEPADAFSWSRKQAHHASEKWDLIIADLPDPSTPEISKLYSVEFYRYIKTLLTPNGVFVTQSTSPIHASKTFRIIGKTIAAAGFSVVPYRSNVPAFGDWGFHVAVKSFMMDPGQIKQKLEGFEETIETKILNQEAVQAAIRFEKGIIDVSGKTEVSRVFNPTAQIAYGDAWKTE